MVNFVSGLSLSSRLGRAASCCSQISLIFSHLSRLSEEIAQRGSPVTILRWVQL